MFGKIHLAFSNVFSGGNINVYSPSLKNKSEKLLALLINQSRNADSLGKETNVPSISSRIGRVLSLIRQKLDGASPLEMDIEAFLPAPKSWLHPKNCIFKYWKVGYFLSWESGKLHKIIVASVENKNDSN